MHKIMKTDRLLSTNASTVSFAKTTAISVTSTPGDKRPAIIVYSYATGEGIKIVAQRWKS